MKSDYSIAVSALKQSDPILAAVIDRVGDCTLDQTQHPGDLLYSLSRSIISQQLSTKAASAIHRRFLTLYSGLPTAQAILDTADEDLRRVGLSRSKVLYMRDLADNVLNGLPTLNRPRDDRRRSDHSNLDSSEGHRTLDSADDADFPAASLGCVACR